MAAESIEQRMRKLENRVNQMWKVLGGKSGTNLPRCPDCGFLLMADESGTHHMQCYACGSWWDVPVPLARFIKATGYKKQLPAGIIPNRRRLSGRRAPAK
jgi:ribosomal protein S27AE